MPRLVLHNGQKEVLNHEARYKVIVAGRRWGKSRAALIALLKAATKKSKQIVWYIAPTLGQARQTMWDVLKDHIPREWVVGEPNETRMTIRLVNGSVIVLKGADQPDRLRGVELHFVVLDEFQDMKPETWDKIIQPTLTSTRGKAIFIGTPKSFNHFYDLYVKGQRGAVYEDKNGVKRRNPFMSWQFPTMMSPFIPKSEIQEAMENTDEKTFNQEYNARFETMSGRVYYAFDRREHVGKYPFNPKLPIIVGQDFNIDPMSSVIMQIQANGEIWVVDEVILYGSNTQETADEVSRRYHRNLNQVTFYPDPAVTQRSTAAGKSDLEVLKDAGFNKIFFKRKHPPIADRVNSVNRLFKTADGQIKMRVNQHCKGVIASLEQTIYKAGTREVDKKMGVEHPADALGYFCDFEFPVHQVSILGVSI